MTFSITQSSFSGVINPSGYPGPTEGSVFIHPSSLVLLGFVFFKGSITAHQVLIYSYQSEPWFCCLPYPGNHRLLSITAFYLCSFGCAGSSLLQGLSSNFKERGYSSCGTQVSHHGSFSCGGAWTLGLKGFSSCGIWAQVLWSMRNLLRPGVKPLSLALAGGFLSTVPPRQSSHILALLFSLGAVSISPYCFPLLLLLFSH